MSSPSLPQLSDSQDNEVARYRAVSTLAVAGVILGVLSILALVDPAGWVFPLLGLVVCLLALGRIRKEAGGLIGRKAALVGLVLSLLFGSAAVTDWFATRWLVSRQARQFAQAWFDLLRDGQPHKALQLTEPPTRRRGLNEALWKFYGSDPQQRKNLEDYVARPAIRALLALGRNAHVHYYRTTGQGQAGRLQVVDQIFTVTYEHQGKKTTFFVVLQLRRSVSQLDQRAAWYLTRAEGGLEPDK